jgi:Reverse transcriptase (RNA-dependent DNA polymerase).
MLRRLSHLSFWDSTGNWYDLTSSRGVDQGDPLSPALFALGLAPVLERLKTELQRLACERGFSERDVMVLAYLDDVCLGVPPDLAEEALAVAEQLLAECGLQLNLTKCKAWSPSGVCPAASLQHLWNPSGLVVLGAPLDGMYATALGNNSFVDEHCDTKKEACRDLLARLED